MNMGTELFAICAVVCAYSVRYKRYDVAAGSALGCLYFAVQLLPTMIIGAR